jgi:hypothetical protein
MDGSADGAGWIQYKVPVKQSCRLRLTVKTGEDVPFEDDRRSAQEHEQLCATDRLDAALLGRGHIGPGGQVIEIT